MSSWRVSGVATRHNYMVSEEDYHVWEHFKHSLLKHNKQRGNHSDPVLLQEKMGKGVSNTAEVVDEKDSEKEEISLKEYEKVLQEKRKALVSLKSGE
ncbi:plasminogen activator inhibitor 1 RNA-binding protein-like protein [Tanacetum coccineum]